MSGDDFKLERDIDHGAGLIRKGCGYLAVETMLKSRLRAARELLESESDRMRKRCSEQGHQRQAFRHCDEPAVCRWCGEPL